MQCSLMLLLLILTTSVALAAAGPHDEMVADFEAAALPVAPNSDGGMPPAFERSADDPHSGAACLRITYIGGNKWGNLRLPLRLSGAETAVRFYLRRVSAEKGAAMHLWLFEADGDGWISRPIKVDTLAAGWQAVEVPLKSFSYQPRGDGEEDLATVDHMLLGCNYANFTADIDDISLVVPDPNKKWAVASSGPAAFTFDTGKPASDWWATLAAEYDPLQFMPESTSPNLGRRGMNESWWTVECERVRKMGLHGMRLWFQIEWWEPFDHRTIANGKTGPYAGFDTSGPRMASVYRFLDMCQKYNVEVLLNFGWKLDQPARYWLAPPDQLDRSNPDIKDPEAHAASLVALLRYLHDVRHYTCITHISLGNEFEYNYPELYPALQRHLVTSGLRDRYVVCGLESNQGIKRSHDLAAAHPEWLDVHTLHNYGTMDLGGLLTDDMAALRDLTARGAGPQTFGKHGRMFYTEFSLGPQSGENIAWAVAGSARAGAYGTGGWRLGDQHLVSVCAMGNGQDRFDHGLHQWGTWEWIPWMKPPRPSYYATSLLTRYTRRGSNVFVPAAASPTGDDPAMPCVCFEKNGQYTVLVINRRKTARAVHIGFTKTIKQPFRRHLFDAAALPTGSYDTIVPGDRSFNSQIEDTLPGHSFALYTTLPDWPQLVVTPYVSVARPGDTIPLKARAIAYNGALRWSVDGGTANGTVTQSGVYRAPAGLPAIDPVIVRATGTADDRAVGLAIVSFSGQPTDPPSRPTVSITRKVGHGSSRMFDLGLDLPLNSTRALPFQITNYGPDPAPFAISTTAPWLTVAPAHGEIAPHLAQTLDVQATVDTHGLKPGTWYRAYIDIASPRGLGNDQLEVFFKTAPK